MVEWDIDEADLIEAIGNDTPEVIEDYPEDARGHSCLVWGRASKCIIHVNCTASDRPFLVTCYRPDEGQWTADLKRRRRNE